MHLKYLTGLGKGIWKFHFCPDKRMGLLSLLFLDNISGSSSTNKTFWWCHFYGALRHPAVPTTFGGEDSILLPFSCWQLAILWLKFPHPYSAVFPALIKFNIKKHSRVINSLNGVLNSTVGSQVGSTKWDRKMTRLSALLAFCVQSLIGGKNWFLYGADCLPSPELTSSTTV